jgi:hypothetical protein
MVKKPNEKTIYMVDETKRQRFPRPMFSVKHIVNQSEVEKYRKRNRGKLPAHVYVVEEGDDENHKSQN